MEWNPQDYLKFEKERTRPSNDLINSLENFIPDSVVDIGCGPGNSTSRLLRKWPKADILGVDSSDRMIKSAMDNYPSLNWRVCEIGKDLIQDKFDLVFSNAAIQWIPEHNLLLKEFYSMLKDGGRLAVQLPLFFNMRLGKIIKEVSESPRWNSLLRDINFSFYINDQSYYYNSLIGAGFKNINIWETRYFHIFPNHRYIMDMIASTGLKPYLERLDRAEDRELFNKLVLNRVEREYKSEVDGTVLFPFIRLFFTGER